jgi:predicted aconitase
MVPETLEKWHSLVNDRNVKELGSVLADDAVFHSPVVHTPQVGKEITTKYLTAAFNALFNDTFTYVREIVGEREAVLEFQVEIEGIVVNGVDIISWNENNRITDFKVMIRPLKAINLVRERMMNELQSH